MILLISLTCCLIIQVEVQPSDEGVKLDDCSFGVGGLKLQGAVCKNNLLQLSTSIITDLPLTCFRWIRCVSQSYRSLIKSCSNCAILCQKLY